MSDRTDVYRFDDREFSSEREMLLHLLDGYRCIEAFAARYLTAWRRVTQDPVIRGGLRTLCGRERSHAAELAARLRELGGTPAREMPADRMPDVDFYGAPDRSDADKLSRLASRLRDHDVLVPIEAALAQIRDDRDTRELLATILDDERASIRWVLDLHDARARPSGPAGPADPADPAETTA